MNKNYIKIVLLGDGRVGKTSILKRYISNQFNEGEEMTVNSIYFEKELEYDGKKFVFCLWVIFSNNRIQPVKKNSMLWPPYITVMQKEPF
jgi:GTPase SAR1 family protein